MPTDVIMPQMGESIFEGTITKWLKKPGDSVQRDEPLFEISTDKVDAEIPSPAAGTLSEIKVEAGSTVQINTVVAVIGEAGGAAASAPAAAAPVPPKQEPTKEAQKVEAPKAATPAPAAPAAAPAPSDGGTDVVMPQMGESIFEGTITKWLKKVGESVQRDEPLFEISTDKVDAEIPSPAAGMLSEIKVEAGSTVQINTVVAVIGGGAGEGERSGCGTCSGSSDACSGSGSCPPRRPLSRPLLHRMASGCGRRRWCARLRKSISSICGRFRVRDRAAASPRTMCCSISIRVAQQRRPPPLLLLQRHNRLPRRSPLPLPLPWQVLSRASWCP